ncbi:hypothetical protein M441DRAFT_299996 [Trichoderma asperellum CBS 433.97]|uniref:Secreted protein n=1 Tax=Trichoderma asperellum (strain ATCC 204424 / CBS 433.97 / NBRC 101777) TaxID=1042311 RepID=A0A2T3ZJ66_TRIA4|nr:hypothetical protein M441DRAFT_299996 [Trichoderma asperellum CBS 433.97]PTB44858.1 hypothetical protein M441DRAFT_299996 [Trichoderma asperellum CBS 433.97]
MSPWEIFLSCRFAAVSLSCVVWSKCPKGPAFISFSASFFSNRYLAAGYPGLITNRPKSLKVTAIASSARTRETKEVEKEEACATASLKKWSSGGRKETQGPPWSIRLVVCAASTREREKKSRHCIRSRPTASPAFPPFPEKG